MMKRILMATAAVAALGATPMLAVPAMAQDDAKMVAGRPALPTTSVEDINKMRSQWGTAPSGEQASDQKAKK